MNNITITMNAEKNGIEIRFDTKPNVDVLAGLKDNGFRWSSRQKLWYARQNDQTVSFAQNLSDDVFSFDASNNKTKSNSECSLFERTRTDNISDQYSASLRPKDIAARIRQHIRPRFPMCRFSVTSDYNSVDIDIKASPFEKDSDELKAICDYVNAYTESFKHSHWEPYSDYYDTNFYFCRCNISYDYEQTDLTVSLQNMVEAFKVEKVAFEEAEELRRHQEYEERMAQLKIEEERNKELCKIAEQKREKIENGVKIYDGKDCFVKKLRDPKISKLNSSTEYAKYMEEDEEPMRYHTCHVSRDVHMTAEQFADFDSMLLHDWSFIAKTGGSETQDNRVNSMLDYQMMRKEERETVEWYSCGCVAIYCDGQLKYVVDAQGYDYCRYVYFVTDETTVSGEYHSEQLVSDDQAEQFKEEAEGLIDLSTHVIEENDLAGKWNGEGLDAYKSAMKEAIYSGNITFDVNVVRAISNNFENLKTVMYGLLKEMNGTQEQVKRARFALGQRITIVKMSDFGGIYTHRAVFESAENSKYAQYDHAVKLVIRPERKRGLYAMWLYDNISGETMIYDGWLPDIPEDVLFDVTSNHNGVVVKKSKYFSCDRRYYDLAYEYYAGLGAIPLVNTDKPERRKVV